MALSIVSRFCQKGALQRTLRNCGDLSQQILTALQPDYPTKTYLYEKRIHDANRRYLKSFLKTTHKIDSVDCLTKFQNIYLLLMDGGQWRWRETDATVFALCQEELIDIKKQLRTAFRLNFSDFPTLELLRKSVLHLEDNYQHVMKVASKDPLIILLFIEALKKMCDELEQLYSSIQNYFGGKEHA